MGLRDRAKGIAKRGYTAFKSTPKAAKTFGKTLVSEAKKDLRDPNSPASKFARAPLGQSYLPEGVQRVGRALLPTPGGVVKSYQKGAREGGLKGFGRIAMTNVDVALLGTTGAAARGVVGAGKVAGRVAGRGLAARGLSFASETGAVRKAAGGVTKAARTKAAQKAIASTGVAAPKAASVAERAAAAAASDFADEAARTAKIRALSDDTIRSALETFGGRSKAIVREAQRRGISALPKAKAAPKPLPSTIGMTAPKGPQPDIMEYAAQKLGSLGRVTRARTSPKGEGIRPAVAKAMGMPAQTMGASEPLGVTKAKSIAERAAAAAERATRKPGPVRTRKMTAAEKASFDSPKTSAGFDKPAETLGVTRAKPSVKVAGAKPAKAPPAEAVGIAPKSKAAEVAARGAGEAEYRETVRSILGQKKIKRGAFTALAKQHGISRQRVGQVVAQERKRLNLTQATNAVPEVGSATKPVVKTAEKVTKAKGTTVAAKPTNVTPAASTTTPKAAKAAPKPKKAARGPKTNPLASPGAPSQAELYGETAAKEAVKVKIPRKAAGETGAQKVKGPAKFLGRNLPKFPKKTAALAGAAVLLANRDKFGVGGKGVSPASKSDESSFVKNLPDGLRQDVEALMAVKAERGDEGLAALRRGLATAQKSQEYNEMPVVVTGESLSTTAARMKQKREKVLRTHVQSAYEKIRANK